jgi:hypothetical protein
MTRSLATRVKRLEETFGDGGGGCDRCVGTLALWENLDGKLLGGSFNGKELSRDDYLEHEADTLAGRCCSTCGREFGAVDYSAITVGGRRQERNEI